MSQQKPAAPAGATDHSVTPNDISVVGSHTDSEAAGPSQQAARKQNSGLLTEDGGDGSKDSPSSTTRKARPSRSAKTKAVTNVIDPALSNAANPSSKRTAGTKATAKARHTASDIPEPGVPMSKPTSAPRKLKAKNVPMTDAAISTDDRLSGPAVGMPKITEEAVAFLGNPDATVDGLFKLRRESQAFVEYHITNMQRLEAESHAAHGHLAATAPQFSPRFEKVIDALLSRVAKRNMTATVVPTISAGITNRTPDAAMSYRPMQSPSITFPTPVQLGKMDINVEQGHTGNRRSLLAHHEQAENTIEPGITTERQRNTAQEAGSRSAEPLTNIADQPPSRQQNQGTFWRVVDSAAQLTSTLLKAARREKVTADVEPPKSGTAPASGVSPAPSDARSTVVPETVTKRFLKVEQDYYFRDKTHAFSDRGNKLATRGEHPEVVRSLIEIAHARGWDNITVKGTEAFRRSAWLEAAQAGLTVAGYKPTALDLAELANRPSKNSVEPGLSKGSRMDDKSTTAPGATKAPTKISGADPTTQAAPPNVAKPDEELTAKARLFESDKASLVVKKHPDLAPAYGVVDVAKKFADAHLPEDAREEFVGLARRHVIQKIVSGEQVRGPQIYSSRPKQKDVSGQVTQPIRDAIQSKAPREKGGAKER
jgi:hypothetical protein